eukprot:31363-Pelagococcus_subviridis.AAC.17
MLLKSGLSAVAIGNAHGSDDASHSPRNDPGESLSHPAVYAVTHSFIASSVAVGPSLIGGPSCANAT